jgi:outer membrane lipoprotein-sorting protein
MKQTIYLTIILCALFLSGCGNSSEFPKNAETNVANVAANTNTNVTVNVVTNTAEEAEKTEKAKNEIVNSTKKLKDLKSWSARMISETMSAVNGEMKFVAPDRFYLKQGGNEAIVIGKDSYVREEGGKWSKSKDDLSSLMEMSKGGMSEEIIKKIKNVRVIGDVNLEGKPTTLYEHKTDENRMLSTTKMWISKESGLLLKSERETIVSGKLQRLTIFFDYEKEVTIESPKIEQ